MQIGQRTPLGAVQTNLLILAGQVRGAKKTTLLAKSKEDNLKYLQYLVHTSFANL